MNINFFSISNYDRAFILARKSDGTLPDTVWERLGTKEGEELLGIIKKIEDNPTDIKQKKQDYSRIMELYYKGIGLDKNGQGTIAEKDKRAALELGGLINDAILQDQQNIKGTYKADDLKEALNIQNQFRNDLEKNNSLKELISTDQGSDNEINAWQKEYQTEKITSYLAKNKDKFADIFKKLSSSGTLNSEEKEMLANLRKLAGEKGQSILNTILGTFKEFKDYDFTDSKMTKMKKVKDSPLIEQAATASTFSRWKEVSKTKEDTDENTVDDNDCSCDEDNSTKRILDRIIKRLEKLTDNFQERERPDREIEMPRWLQAINAGIGVAGNFLRTTGLGAYENCCYTPLPCYGGGYNPRQFCRIPIWTDGDTWPWGRTGGGVPSNNFGFGPYMPSSSSVINDPANNNYSPINVTVNPIFNNNPNQSNSNAIRNSPSLSSNIYEISQQFRASRRY